MPNSPSQMIADMLDWRQMLGSGRPRRGNNSVETVLLHPCHFPRAWHLFKRSNRCVGVKGSTRNGRCDPKCPSARCLRMVREDTWVPSEGASCVWMATDEAVGCTSAFRTMRRSSQRLVCRGRPERDLRVNDISRMHWSPNILTTQSERPN
ncbi:uncharacterized protein TNCV_3931981 [Trichonephila clavipes]|nr:uncharacterized protein TNCV_3931981 [Trichonephila clavipes]